MSIEKFKHAGQSQPERNEEALDRAVRDIQKVIHDKTIEGTP